MNTSQANIRLPKIFWVESVLSSVASLRLITWLLHIILKLNLKESDEVLELHCDGTTNDQVYSSDIGGDLEADDAFP